jgi:hypothetical protein
VAVACGAGLSSLAAAPAWAFHPWGWQHALRVVRDLRTDPPQAPLVVLLGGSCARESTVSDQSWTAEVLRRGSPVVAYNLGSSNQTFEQDVALVEGLPRVPAIVFIALNRGRFTAAATVTTSIAPSRAKGIYTQHHYSSASIEAPKRKRARVRFWVRMRYSRFEQHYAADAAVLDRLIGVCLRLGYHPVLLEMPRNAAVIGHAFDAAISKYQAGAQKLVTRHRIPYLRFVHDLHLASTDFYDDDHLVESGRPKFQGRLAQETSRLLALYGMQPARAGTAATPSASGAGELVAWPLGAAAVVAAGALALRRRTKHPLL